jgi:hypothetical protein
MEIVLLERCVRANIGPVSTWVLISLCSKLIALMSLGYRIEAISILGREVMLPRGLVGLGFDSIDLCGPEIAEVGVTYPVLPI